MWVVSQSSSKQREKLELDRLAEDLPSNLRLLQQAREILAESRELKKKAQSIIESIPRITIEDLREIASNRLDQEQDKAND